MPPSGFNDGRPRFKNPLTGHMVLNNSTTHIRLCKLMRDGKIPKKSIPPCKELKTRGRKKGTQFKDGKAIKKPKTVKIKVKEQAEKSKTIKIKVKTVKPPSKRTGQLSASQRLLLARVQNTKNRIQSSLLAQPAIPLIKDASRPFIRKGVVIRKTPKSRKKIKNVKGRQAPIASRATDFLLLDLLEQRRYLR